MLNQLLDQMVNAKGGAGRLADIPAGVHQFAVLNYSEKQTRKDGPIVEAEVIVLESSTLAVGSRVGKVWFVGKPSPYADTHYAQAEAREFMMTLLGDTDPRRAVQAMIEACGREKEQPLRGMRINCRATENNSKNGKTFVKLAWTTVQQKAEDIVGLRKRIDGGEFDKAAPAPTTPSVAVTTPTTANQVTEQSAATPSVLGNLFGR